MKNNYKTALLVAALLAAALAGVWLAISPSLKQQEAQAKQAELLKQIENGSGTVELPEPALKKLPDYYDAEENDVFVFTASPPEDQPPEPISTPEPVDTGIVDGIGILTIEKIDARLPVTAGVSKTQLKIAEGWVTQTAPIGSEGNAVIAGHRSYTYGQHFNRLGELEAGDTIGYISTDGEVMTFAITEILTVEPGDPATFAAPPEGVSQLTLYTCTPIREATHRLLVRALRVEE